MPAMTLDTVEEAFIAWRKNRSSRTEPIPQSLWEHIFHIYHDYSLAEICRRLRLSSGQFKRGWQQYLQHLSQGALSLPKAQHLMNHQLPPCHLAQLVAHYQFLWALVTLRMCCPILGLCCDTNNPAASTDTESRAN